MFNDTAIELIRFFAWVSLATLVGGIWVQGVLLAASHGLVR